MHPRPKLDTHSNPFSEAIPNRLRPLIFRAVAEQYLCSLDPPSLHDQMEWTIINKRVNKRGVLINEAMVSDRIRD
jgi:hypothetical protein